MAKRARFQAEYLTLAEFFFFFREFATLDSRSLRDYSRLCYKCARRYKSIPYVPYVPLNCYFCFSVVVAQSVPLDIVVILPIS